MISLIAAIGKERELGKNNKLIWTLPKDLKFFKETTLNHPVIMGYNTYLSIGKALPNRKNIVIVDHKNYQENEEVIFYNDMEELINKEIVDDEEIFIIGGASMYNFFYPFAKRMYLTLIDETDKEADTYFPVIEEDKWQKTILSENCDNGINYKHVLFERVNK